MPTEIYNKSHPAGPDPQTRIANRLRNSGGGSQPNSTSETWPQRTVTNIHHRGGGQKKGPASDRKER